MPAFASLRVKMDSEGFSGYNPQVDEMREHEFPMLKGSTYLDHAGTTLYSRTLMDRFSASMMSNLLGNPHSGSISSQDTTSRIENIRLRLLHFFNADSDDFDLVFVANATAGIKLVLEAFRCHPNGFHYAYHQACHTSIVGAREEARSSVCLNSDQVETWIRGETPFPAPPEAGSAILFSYSAQSHMDGNRYPRTWPKSVRETQETSPVYTLLDAASLAATSPLDLSDADSAPDFVVTSLYKIFGFPDLGALLVRRQAQSAFRFRRYFGGGTVDTVVCGKEDWHMPKSQFLHERLEDGTLPFHSIIALDAALDAHHELFGSMLRISSHTAFLSRRLYDGLCRLKHENGSPVCVLYSPEPSGTQRWDNGPIVSFNIVNALGAWISLYEFEKLCTLKNFHIRTGGLCSPGGIAAALDLQPWEVRRNFSSGFRCGTDQDIISGKPTGVIRASLGAMSNISDIDSFIAFVEEFYREATPVRHESRSGSVHPVPGPSAFKVEELVVYPIKSCAGFAVPSDTAWEIKPEGLAWDREWCLVHQGTGQALNQKRYPKMALLRPSLDFDSGVLRVKYHGKKPQHLLHEEVTIPLSVALSKNLSMSQSCRTLSSRVCGDDVTTQACMAPEANAFFSEILGVPCLLVRFPAGGQGRSMRHSKAQIQKHQWLESPRISNSQMPGAFPTPHPPSPPESDSEQTKSQILLSNESPILMVNTASLDALNRGIVANGGLAVPISAFRANIVVSPAEGGIESSSGALPYAEDKWKTLQIGTQSFKPMGSCRRCQMVCIDQETGKKNQEPFVTLAKTRRFDGKVYFGTHMRHDTQVDLNTREAQFPTISVGDAVQTSHV